MKREPLCIMEVREEEALPMEFDGELSYFCLKDAATGSWKSIQINHRVTATS